MPNRTQPTFHLGFNYFAEACRQRNPDIKVIEGEPCNRDRNMNLYTQLDTFGRSYAEGQLIAGLVNADFSLAAHVFWTALTGYIMQADTIHVRRIPEFASHLIYELDTFTTEVPRFIEREIMHITCRLTMYKNGGLISPWSGV